MQQKMQAAIAKNYKNITAEIQDLLRVLQRPSDSVRLLAVSKGQPLSALQTLLQLGHRDFGENYVQEWKMKREALRQTPIHWHFTGRLQTNKIKDVVGSVEFFHAIDRLDLAQKLNALAAKKGIVLSGLLEINLAEESSKTGFQAHELFKILKDFQELESLKIKGLMALPPLVKKAEHSRPYFRALREILFEVNARKLYKVPLTELSMGMSQDYDVAIEEGATWVRIGTRLFGQRD